jgi:hypothetical protein
MATFITKIKPRKYGLEGFFLIVGRGFEAGKLLEAIRQWGRKGAPPTLQWSLLATWQNKLSGPKNLMVPERLKGTV